MGVAWRLPSTRGAPTNPGLASRTSTFTTHSINPPPSILKAKYCASCLLEPHVRNGVAPGDAVDPTGSSALPTRLDAELTWSSKPPSGQSVKCEGVKSRPCLKLADNFQAWISSGSLIMSSKPTCSLSGHHFISRHSFDLPPKGPLRSLSL